MNNLCANCLELILSFLLFQCKNSNVALLLSSTSGIAAFTFQRLYHFSFETISWLCFAFGSPIALVVHSHRTSNCFAIVRRGKNKCRAEQQRKKKKISSRFKVTQHKRESRRWKKKKNNEGTRKSWKRSWKKMICYSSIIISFNA